MNSRRPMSLPCFALLNLALTAAAVASSTLRPDLDDPARLQSLKHTADHKSRVHEGVPKPHFVTGLAQHIETQVDEPTYLHCRVRNHDKYKVAWIREADYHPLTIDTDVFTGDRRFQVSHFTVDEYTKDWMLIIRNAVRNDTGRYLCQVSTSPPTVFYVDLLVHEGQSTLSGPEAVRSGSEITLKCVVELDDATLAANTPYNIQWLLNDTALKTNDDRKYMTNASRSGNTVTHRLSVKSAGPGDMGLYTCKPQFSAAKSMLVRIDGAANRPIAITLTLFTTLISLLARAL